MTAPSDWLIAAIPHAATHASLLLLIGLTILAIGGNYIVPATTSLGSALRLSPAVIAVIVVAGGTSAPELIVSLQAALAGSADIAIGNVIGSNMSNILLVMGLAAICAPFTLHHRTAIRTSLIMLLFTGATMASLLIKAAITFNVAIMLLSGTAAYLLYLIRIGDITAHGESEDTPPPSGLGKALIATAASIIALVMGADFVVSGGVIIASQAGLSEAAIGLSIIAIGTSLPEIVAVIAAVLQRRSDVALGNVLGSNIFNLGMILGTTALLAPLNRSADISDGTLYAFGLATCLITTFIIARTSLKRPIGFVFVGFYFLFLAVQF